MNLAVDDLQRHTEAVVIAAPIRQQLPIGIVQVKVANELGLRGLAGVATNGATSRSRGISVSMEFGGIR